MVAAFPQLHHQISEGGLADFTGIVGELHGCLF
jgi:hypothetical protein